MAFSLYIEDGDGIWIAFIVALIIGYGINELLGVIIIIDVVFYAMMNKWRMVGQQYS